MIDTGRDAYAIVGGRRARICLSVRLTGVIELFAVA